MHSDRQTIVEVNLYQSKLILYSRQTVDDDDINNNNTTKYV